MTDQLTYARVTELAAAVRDREVSSSEVVSGCLRRIEEVNPHLNAVVQLAADDALAQARRADAALATGEVMGPLHGVPMTLKDSLDTKDMVTTGGTKGRTSFTPTEDATVAARLRAAGAILLGKTNTPEFTFSFSTDNLVYGRTSNPYDTSCSPGGSSGGAAAIVAAGGSPFDIGSDYCGSIRYPAHCCGIAGIKPTSGRVPRTGHALPFGGLTDSFQQIGPMARSVKDLAMLLPIIAGPDWIDPAVVPMPWQDPNAVDLGKLRVAFHTDNGIFAPPRETAAVVESAARILADVSMSVEEVCPNGLEDSFDVAQALSTADGGALLRRLLEEAGTTEHSLPWLDGLQPLSATELETVVNRWYTVRSAMLSFFKNYDVVLSPVNAFPAMPHGTEKEFKSYSYTMAYNLTGWPAGVVRGGTSSEGLPIGVQIVAHPWREDVALAVAALIEESLGGFQPPQNLR